MPRPTLATIYPNAIAHNLQRARLHAPAAFQWAVVKANAYGHGIERIFSGLQAADGLAMLDFAEAAWVRRLGWIKPVLMLEGCFDYHDVLQCEQQSLTAMIHSQQQLDLHRQHPKPIAVQIKLNTGMNRLGFAPNQLDTLAQQLLAMPHLRVEMWVTHFADADIAQATDAPLYSFCSQLAALFQRYPTLQAPLSASNSAAISQAPAAHLSAVRSGIMTYGSSPLAHQTAAAAGLKPAMCLSSQLIATQQLKAGDSVGYGSTFTAPKAMRIGIAACGYADGYPRSAPTGTPVAVDGVVTRTVGRVSMDMLAVDLTHVPLADVGSAVELWGNIVAIDDVARSAGTIAYELMCALAARVRVGVSDSVD